MTKSLAAEVAGRNITVNCVAPGFISTSMTEVLKPEQKAAILPRIPAGRIGETGDVAAAVASWLLYPAPPEPTWNGKPLSYWMENLQREGGRSGPPFSFGIPHIGPKALPCLVRDLSRRDSLLNDLWFKIHPKLPSFVRQKFRAVKSRARIRWAAARGLQELGPFASSALPALGEAMHDRNFIPRTTGDRSVDRQPRRIYSCQVRLARRADLRRRALRAIHAGCRGPRPASRQRPVLVVADQRLAAGGGSGRGRRSARDSESRGPTVADRIRRGG